MSSLPMGYDAIFRKAVQYHQSGRLQAAEQIYHRILEMEAKHTDSLHLLGLLAHQADNHEKAASLISKAIEISPHTPLFHCSLGGVFQALGNSDRAIACFRRALDLDPNYFEALYNLGNAFQIQNRFQEAILAYQTALKIRPEFADAYYNLGWAYQKLKNFPEALQAYQKALELKSDYADAYNSMGIVYQELDRPDQAYRCYRKALEINPDSEEALNNIANLYQKEGNLAQAILKYQQSLTINASRADTYSNLGQAYMRMERFEDALVALRKAVAIEPGGAEYHFNLGNAFLQQGQFAEAIGCYQAALKIFPDYRDAFINLGNAFHRSGRFDEACSTFYKALECDPDCPIAYNNLGKAHQDQGQFKKARRFYQKALQLRSGYAEAHFNHALILLMLGEFAEGWQEYEWRFKRTEWKKTYPHNFQVPRWDGSCFAGKRLLVHSEQGFGDTLQFVRYLPMVKARGGTVILEVAQPILGLLENWTGIDELVMFSSDNPSDTQCDLYIPLLSLPGIFGTDLKSIPAEVPYLRADPLKSLHWRKQLTGSHFKVGLVWSGKPTDPNRSCALTDFYPLAGISGIRLYGLQKGAAAIQAEQLPAGMKVTNLGQVFEDFSDTASAIENLDLIISIDTSVAHLAGAMGKPVWVLLPFVSDWRWLLSREDSPWYPTMKLYRQEKRGDWQAVCKRLAADLRDEVASLPLTANGRISTKTQNDEVSDRSRSLRNGDKNFSCRKLIRPRAHPTAALQQAVAAYHQGDHHLALAWVNKALNQDSENPLCHFALGLIRAALEKIDEAILSFHQAIRLKPEFGEAHFNLGLALKKQGLFDAAKSRFEQVLQLNPHDAEAFYNLGNILKAQGELEDAGEKYGQALKLNPDYAEAFNNLGLVLKEQGRIEAAIEKYQQAINLKQDLAEAHWNLSLAHLLAGNFEKGWIEYEWRFKRGPWAAAHPAAHGSEIWDGSSFRDLRLLIRGEQGIGDNLQFVRYLPLVKSRGGTIIFETMPALHTILQDFPGIDQLCSTGLNAHLMPRYDASAPLLSLPRIFNTRLDTIPASVPYLYAPEGKVQAWQKRIAADGLRVGIVWAGRPEHENDANRSCALRYFMPLAQMEGIRLYGLQKGTAALEANHLPPGTNFKNFGEALEDFADTAGIIENLDLVISVDTAVAHLAGAMGKTVWVLLPHAPDWRWLMDREDSPWYPSMRLFRQKSRGDWDGVFHRLVLKLKNSSIG